MEENKYDHNPEEGYDYEREENEAVKKSLRGYRVVIILLAIILAGLSILYFNLNRQQQQDYALLQADRDTIQSNLNSLITEYDDLKYQNDTIAAQLEKAKEMVEQLKYERRLNYNKIKAYQKEVGTLRAVMKNYLRQIDSLNTVNKKVIGENVSLRKEISTEKLRADVAEERASELQNKVAQGSVLRARDITLVALNANDKIISRVKNAATLRVDFTVGANELAKAGNRPIYLCITSPDGYLLSTDAMPTFSYQGTKKGYSASREVDYQNEDLDVSIFYKGSGFIPGTYKIELYMDGNLIGSSEVAVR
jgi:DNA repair ATPase RecN